MKSPALRASGLMRMGTLDSTFNPPPTISGAIALLLDGKVISSLPVARLNPDGSVDSTFNPPADFMGLPEFDGPRLISGTLVRNGDLLGPVLSVARGQ